MKLPSLNLKFFLFAVVACSFLGACKAPEAAKFELPRENSEAEVESPLPDEGSFSDEGSLPDEETDSETPSVPNDSPAIPEDLSVCSDLDYSGVNWSDDLDFEDRQALLLALNISGSFEGSAGWANLTNNFDNQGISMGLLNQTLGMGSLQPLLSNFRRKYPQSYASVLSASQRTSMNKMLDAWEDAKGFRAMSLEAPTASLGEAVKFDSTGAGFSFELPDASPIEPERVLIEDIDPLNIDKFYALVSRVGAMDSATSASVSWALNTVYTSTSGKTFKSDWKQALKNLGSHPDYVSLQIKAAEVIHKRALNYQYTLGFYQLRGYLMLFDIGVQNGSLQQKHFDQFWSWLNSNRNASLETQMIKLIDIRASSSLAQYRDDVKSRKKTIVWGQGYVHGENRNLPAEYCYSPLKTYPNTLTLP